MQTNNAHGDKHSLRNLVIFVMFMDWPPLAAVPVPRRGGGFISRPPAHARRHAKLSGGSRSDGCSAAGPAIPHAVAVTVGAETQKKAPSQSSKPYRQTAILPGGRGSRPTYSSSRVINADLGMYPHPLQPRSRFSGSIGGTG